MNAARRCLLQACRRSYRHCTSYGCKSKRCVAGSISASLFTVQAQTRVENEGSLGGIQTVNPVHLSHPFLIRNAAVSSVDAATTLLTQTVTALLQAQKEYIEAVSHLLTVMEANLKVLGNPVAEQEIWDLVMEARFKMNEKAVARQELETLFAYTEKLLNTAAEAAYAAGAEYASIASSERLLSAQTQLKIVQEQSKDATLKLAQMETKTIQKTSEQIQESKGDNGN